MGAKQTSSVQRTLGLAQQLVDPSHNQLPCPSAFLVALFQKLVGAYGSEDRRVQSMLPDRFIGTSPQFPFAYRHIATTVEIMP